MATMIDRDVLLEFVSAGIRASSPDNSEPWKFKLTDDGIELYLDKRFLGMFFDVNCYASLLGCGGVIENIRLTASTKGYQTSITKCSATQPEYKVASLSFQPSQDIQVDPLTSAIYQRSTHRGFYYRDQVISPTIIDNLETTVKQSYSDAYIHWFTGEQKNQLTDIITDTDRLRYTHQELHNDFYSKLRFGKQSDVKNDGLAVDTLGLERIFCWALPLLKSWSFVKLLNKFGMHYFMAFRGAKMPLQNAARVGALVMPRHADTLSKGTALHRLWLAINANQDLYCQPFGALPLFIYRMNEVAGEGFDEQQRRFLATEINKLNQLIGLDSDSEQVIIIFRIGYSTPPAAYSRRRPVESFLLQD
ncbi:hypothetical protein R3X26_00675 [Vibrio sp. TH_r3]|uniref:hypothetical protein n=1 Tax=Vibrio sp. TH_r3 TaxID=3082084 RepID=UPI00295576D8|nr:hypothetical protein [Vibrio sp. TH_r3]MDV7102916.1 hypothetical protein [Vibrio sp. TH_r3]